MELWFILALGAAFAIQAAYVSIPLCWKRYHLKPTSFSAFYFAGTAVGVILFLLMQRGWSFVPGQTTIFIVSIVFFSRSSKGTLNFSRLGHLLLTAVRSAYRYTDAVKCVCSR